MVDNVVYVDKWDFDFDFCIFNREIYQLYFFDFCYEYFYSGYYCWCICFEFFGIINGLDYLGGWCWNYAVVYVDGIFYDFFNGKMWLCDGNGWFGYFVCVGDWFDVFWMGG